MAMETSREKVIVLCYWDGCIKYGPDGVYYEGTTSEKFRVKQKTELSRLLDGLYHLFGLDRQRSNFEIWGKLPVLVQQSKLKYLLLPVVDDSSFETMLDVPSNHPSITNVELYLEVKTTSDGGIDSSFPLVNPSKRQRTDPNSSSEGCLNKSVNFSPGGVSKPCLSSSLWLDDDMRLGLCFKDVDELNKAVDWYSIRARRKCVARETEKKDMYRFECVRTKCNWSLDACRVQEEYGLVEITKYNATHSCSPVEDAKSDVVADEIERVVRLNPTLSIQELKKWWKDQLGYELQTSDMRDGKLEAIRRVYGDEEQSLRAIPKLISAFQSSNEMLVEWRYEVFPNPKFASFSGLFWTFSQSVKGFQHCRPLVVVDTRDLYGDDDVSPRRSQFKLMIASGLDAATRYFPLAFAVTKEVSVETWRWFLSGVKEKVTQREGLCLISSPDKDIVTVVNEPGSQWEEPWAYHRFCLKGLCSQFCDVFEDCGEELVCLVKKAGYSSQKSEFDSYMNDIKEKKPEAWKWLNKILPHQWALAHDNGSLRYGVMEIDTKALYAVFRDFRVAMSGVVVLMFDELREAFNESFTCSRDALNRGDVYTKPVMDKLEEFVRDYDAGDYVVTPLEGDAFEVSGKEMWIVQLSDSVCTCGKFQDDKFPCVHALALCDKLRINPLKYVDDCYSLERYHKTYSAEFNLVPEVSAWPEASGVPTLLPPKVIR
uniref:SWIM-type domain-containing protein n=1 Tax=Noccaea caerulescens TaxID=107243 RepID=A0A1J3E6M8_NOCCA